MLQAAGRDRPGDLINFDATDRSAPLSFNPLERVPPERRGLAAASLLEIFRKLWPESWGPRLEHILRNCLLALLELPEATLGDVLRLLDEPPFRKSAAGRVANAQVRRFWLREFESYTARFRVEAVAPIQNKVGAFLSDPTLSRILDQPRSSFITRQIMDEGKVLLVNLAKGRIGEDATRLMGALITSALGLGALSRVDLPEMQRRDFSLYLDEFHGYATLSLATMLSELRKYRLNLVLAHQYLGQLEPPIRDAILGNVGTIIVFRVGLTDAELLAREFYPDFAPVDLVNLPNHHAYARVMVDGVVTKPFSVATLPPSQVLDLPG